MHFCVVPVALVIPQRTPALFPQPIRECLRQALAQKNAKPLLQEAGLTIHQVTNAEIWTTALRDRRKVL